MIVDDRLDTVLRTVASGAAGARTQYRQVLDLLDHAFLARANGGADDAGSDAGAGPATQAEALQRLAWLGDWLSEDERAELVRAARPQSAALIAYLAQQPPRIAAAALGAARLDAAHWLAMIPALPVQARGFLRHRRDLPPEVNALLARLGILDMALPRPEPVVLDLGQYVAAPQTPAPIAAEQTPAPAVTSAAPASAMAPPRGGEAIGAIVRRIEAFRHRRATEPAADPPSGADPRLPFPDDAAVNRAPRPIGLSIDPAGMIVGADGASGAMLFGHRPFTRDPAAPAQCDAVTFRAARERRPIIAGRVRFVGAPAITGAWRIDATPRFDEGGGFTGWRGVLRRPAMPAAANDDPVRRDADRLRQLLHELRTPINAIQGFAEMIQQQALGPVSHHYRGYAASIAADAARMLADFEDVDRLARLESGREPIAPGDTDLRALVLRAIARLGPALAQRQITIEPEPGDAPLPVAVSAAEAERMVWRLLTHGLAIALPGTAVRVWLAQAGERASLAIAVPRGDGGGDGSAIAAPTASLLARDFAMRLLAAEARAAGGALHREPGAVRFELPLLTHPAADPSDGARALAAHR